MILIATFVASLAVAAPVRHRKRKTHHVTRPAAVSPVVARITLLALRREMLHDFLVETGTQAPAFTDARVHDAGGLAIGPTLVVVDFLGSPVVRARVRNASGKPLDALVIARVRDATGTSAQASTWIEKLAPGESKAIEIYCPGPMAPASVEWTVTPL
jgi:hypothetical protein